MPMKYSPNWQVFMERLDKEFPQWGSSLMLPFPDDYHPPKYLKDRSAPDVTEMLLHSLSESTEIDPDGKS